MNCNCSADTWEPCPAHPSLRKSIHDKVGASNAPRKHLVYIASTLTNAPRVRWLRDKLADHGIEVTYDWTEHGNAAHLGREGLSGIAWQELEGVKKADTVIVLFPAKRGSHVELGAAIALGKRVILVGDGAEEFFLDKETCAFYWHPWVERFSGNLNLNAGAYANFSLVDALAHMINARPVVG